MNEKLHEELMPLLQELGGVAGLNAVLTIQKIVQLANLHRDNAISVEWRQELFRAAHKAGMFEHELAAFDGILARYGAPPATAACCDGSSGTTSGSPNMCASSPSLASR